MSFRELKRWLDLVLALASTRLTISLRVHLSRARLVRTSLGYLRCLALLLQTESFYLLLCSEAFRLLLWEAFAVPLDQGFDLGERVAHMDPLSLIQFGCLQNPHVMPAEVAKWHGLAEEILLQHFVLCLSSVCPATLRHSGT
jgi:hypothetical protein